MDEFKFVIKCFLFACVLLVLSQLKLDGLTVEARLQRFLISEPVSLFVNESAQGGAKFIRVFAAEAQQKFNQLTGKTHSKNEYTRRISTEIEADSSDVE